PGADLRDLLAPHRLARGSESEFAEVQQHREDVDDHRGGVRHVAVRRQGLVDRHQFFPSRAVPAATRDCGDSPPAVPSRSAASRANSSPYPAWSVRARPPTSTTVRSPEPAPASGFGTARTQMRRRLMLSDTMSPLITAMAETRT